MTATARPRRPSALADIGRSIGTIMVKELRSRMRGRRPFVVLTAYLAVLALVAYGVYVTALPEATSAEGSNVVNASGIVGMAIFSVLSILQVVLVSVMAPAFTAGQVSLEREKQTLDLLVTTPLRPEAIVLGKLATALAFVVLLVLAAIPITAIVLMYGGARVENIVEQQVVLLATAIGFGAIGIFASALLQRTQAATVVAYCAVIAAILGSAMVFGAWQTIAQRTAPLGIVSGSGAPEPIRYVNPMVAMLDVVAAVEPAGGTAFTRPLYEQFGTDLASGAFAREEALPVDLPGVNVANPDAGVGAGAPVVAAGLEPVGYWWPRFTAAMLVLAAVLTLLSMRLVAPDTTGRRWPWSRRRSA